MNQLKLAAVVLAAITALSVPVSVFAQADAEKMQKHVVTEQKNINLETEQSVKRNQSQAKLDNDRATGRNIFVKGKDKMMVKYHNARLRHETKKGANLKKDIRNGH